MNANSAFTGSYIETSFWYQQFDLRLIRILRGGQPIVDFDAADNCRLYVTMEAMNFQDDTLSIPIDNFKDHYVLVFDLTSMQDFTENCHYPELRLELNITFPLEHVTELIVLGERSLQLQLTSLAFGEKMSKLDNIAIQQITNRILFFKCRYLGSFPSYYVPTLPNDSFAIINTRPINT